MIIKIQSGAAKFVRREWKLDSVHNVDEETGNRAVSDGYACVIAHGVPSASAKCGAIAATPEAMKELEQTSQEIIVRHIFPEGTESNG